MGVVRREGYGVGKGRESEESWDGVSEGSWEEGGGVEVPYLTLS